MAEQNSKNDRQKIDQYGTQQTEQSTHGHCHHSAKQSTHTSAQCIFFAAADVDFFLPFSERNFFFHSVFPHFALSVEARERNKEVEE